MGLADLFTHLLEVIKQLQSSAQTFSNETAALATTTHELDAIEPGDKLIGTAGRSMALYIGLWSAVYCVEHHKAVLGSAIVSPKVRLCGWSPVEVPAKTEERQRRHKP